MDNAEMNTVVGNAWRVASAGIREILLAQIRDPGFRVVAHMAPWESISYLFGAESDLAFDKAIESIREHFGPILFDEYEPEIVDILEGLSNDEVDEIIDEAVLSLPWLVPGSASIPQAAF